MNGQRLLTTNQLTCNTNKVSTATRRHTGNRMEGCYPNGSPGNDEVLLEGLF